MLRLKICGNHALEDVALLAQYRDRVDYVGFIFTPVSKRYVSASLVQEWLELFPELREKAVAVFLNQSLQEIVQIVQQTGLKIVQLHGQESVADCQQLRAMLAAGTDHASQPSQIWKVIPVEEEGVAPYEAYLPFVDALLLDTKVQGQSGGTGQRFDWSVIPAIMEKVEAYRLPLYIAGGITPDNVSQLVESYSISGIDLAGGIETSGTANRKRKDEQKLLRLLDGVKKDAIN